MEDIIWSCYQEGFEAWDAYVNSGWANKKNNPYETGTIEWRSWNRGWNTNDNGLTDPAPASGEEG